MLTKIEHAKAGSTIKTNGPAWIRIVWIRGNRIGYEKTELDPQKAGEAVASGDDDVAND